MKKYFNLFYTHVSKSILIIIIVLLSWNLSGNVLKLYLYSTQNYTAVINVVSQGKYFDYYSSEFLDDNIRTTVSNVLEYSLKYMHLSNTDGKDKEEYDYYMRLSNESYKSTTDYLNALRGVRFAVVNHDTGVTVSNIDELDGASSGTDIRAYFGKDMGTVLIVHNCKNPYFEAGIAENHIGYIRHIAQNYSDDFDLYIEFSQGLCFVEDESFYERLHNEAKDHLLPQSVICLVLFAILSFTVAFILAISGKAEKGGKITATASDKIPNDLMILLYVIALGSLLYLYHVSLYMLFRSSVIEYFWFFSTDFYKLRANICFVSFTVIITSFLCKIKRQKKLGTLASNTYTSKAIAAYKQYKNASDRNKD